MAAVPPLPAFDWRAPDYAPILQQRVDRLRRIRANPSGVPAMKAYYQLNPIQFVEDWGMTSDPRNATSDPPRDVLMPFLLFPKQRECAEWILERARNKQPGLVEKSRDCGLSWLAMALAVTLCLFNRNMVIGFGSSKEDKVDLLGSPDCLFWKGRQFLAYLPPEFREGFEERRDSPHMRILFRRTESAIIGEAGTNIGRGGRQSITFLDEAAHIEQPAQIDAALASTTNCRIDISSVNGMANSFAEKRFSGRVPVFTFSWRDDPRKGEDWYAQQKATLDPVTLAAEIDLDYRASSEGVLIPSEWIQSAIDAHKKLNLSPTGFRRAALDVADEGRDLNAFAGRHGILLEALTSWSGKDRDILDSVLRAFSLCDEHRYDQLLYDGDGLGAGVRGDARIINEQRQKDDRPPVNVDAFRGSAAVEDPKQELIEGRKNEDFFANLKAQSYWWLRARFQATHRAVTEGSIPDPDALISLSSTLKELPQLIQELSQPTYSLNLAGKVLVDKTPDGARSPNLADAVMIVFSPILGLAEMWGRLV
ncbi:MAG: TerL protein [Proteobacteria bacterium]|nr:TerL protein [Pseudomonadota bacterium]